MAISDWPEGDRPREKFLSLGPQFLSDTELLAIFYRTGTHGKTAVDLARETLNYFGSLGALLSSGMEDFCKVPGLGVAKYVQLQAASELSKRCFLEQIPERTTLQSSESTRHYLLCRMRDYPYEVFSVLYLDNQHRLLTIEDLFRGTISSASIYPREVVRQVIKHNAAAVVFAHNHPSGVAEPSQSDIEITALLTKALNLIEVRVLDHFIVGTDTVTSLAEQGLM